eukprot:TRINITY_DN10106_c0_g1_i1.p1 TRINITY_DN10106_c0_g1~~TRINITY_DN10106_c0_g1_i1.p1  ORF type:complete len:170 (-),score=48.61 TRINITY_DN10106_c0_g1_i1:679-1134(-)
MHHLKLLLFVACLPLQVFATNTTNCPPYTATNTDDASVNTVNCDFTACGGQSVATTNVACEGDQYLRLFDTTTDTELLSDDDGGDGYCSGLNNYLAPYPSSECRTLQLRQGCYSDESCSGTMRIDVRDPGSGLSCARLSLCSIQIGHHLTV